MRLTLTVTAVAVVLLTPRAVPAQVGSLDERTDYAVVVGPSRGTIHGPLLAIVLWRGEPGWSLDSNALERARTDSVIRTAGRRAEDADLSFHGSGNAYALVDRDYHRMIVEGREFPLAPGDSTLVVMVTVPSGNGPRVVTTAHISSTLPPEYWPSRWTRGDTAFIVRPSFVRLHAILLAALRQSPAVAAYLR